MPQHAPAIEAKPAQQRLRIKPGYEWSSVLAQAVAAVPEAFHSEGTLVNLIDGQWSQRWSPAASARPMTSPLDATALGTLPFIDLATGQHAVKAARAQQRAWGKLPLAQRRDAIAATLGDMRRHRDVLAALLMWEIGKPASAANADVDRCIEGVQWYVDNIDGMLQRREPLGLISNIASWNYPLSVLVHVVLVQALAGNSVIAKAPSDGGGISVALCMAFAHRHQIPVSFVCGAGSTLSNALVRNPYVDCLSFVGGRTNGRDIAAALVDTDKRYMIEMEGVNAYGVWEFSQWPLLAQQIKKGFEYAKQRCTAYPRFVVQRTLLPDFLETYLGVVRSLRMGHPMAVAHDSDPLPSIDVGPVINARKVEDLRTLVDEALTGGALPIFQARLHDAALLPGQDTSSYFPPATLLNLPRSSKLYYNEPFGPLDIILAVDRVEELVAEMNVSNGNLVTSLATDNDALAARVANEVRAFKFGHNRLRSRGDKNELFGGLGQSWKGCFVGGSLLVRAVTQGPGDDELPGVFPSGTRLPIDRP